MSDQTQRFKMLIEANQALAQIESLDELLPQLLKLAQEVTMSQGASLMLYNKSTKRLHFALALNEVAGVSERIHLNHISLPLGEGIAGHVAETCRPVLVEDTSQDPRFSSIADDKSGFETKSILCVPILYKDELLGVVQAVNAKFKPSFDDDDLDLLSYFAYLAAVALVRSRLLDQLLEQERFKTQLDTAARIQSHFWPKLPSLGSGCNVWSYTHPAIVVGGDYHDCIEFDDGSYLFCIADVAGKGLPAALVGAALWAKIRGLAHLSTNLSLMMRRLDTEMAGVMGYELFATLAVIRFWPQTCTARFAIAGHVPPILVSASGITSFTNLNGHPIGVDIDENFDTHEIQLSPGDSLVLVTDGVTEAMSPDRVMFGLERLADILSTVSCAPRGPAISEAIKAWTHSDETQDDITILELFRV